MKKKLQPIALWLVTLIAVATVLLFFESDLLWKVQQHNVFLTTSLFFQQMMAMPGGGRDTALLLVAATDVADDAGV